MSNDKDIITKTNDGYVVELFAKVGTKSKIEDVMEGISILEPAKSLDEEELYCTYREIVEKMNYKPVIMRVPEIQKEITVLKAQIRAMLRAGAHGDLSIVFSKISTVIELKEIKEIVEECQKELEVEKKIYKKHIKMGTIVEIPSVTLMSYELAKECDFFFIETNSLTNYTFGSKKNTELYKKLQLPIIKLIRQTIEGAHDAGIFCGICGDAVENKLYIPLLIGLGLDQFSIESNTIPQIRMLINQLDKSDCRELAREVLELRTLEDIERKLKQFIQN